MYVYKYKQEVGKENLFTFYCDIREDLPNLVE